MRYHDDGDYDDDDDNNNNNNCQPPRRFYNMGSGYHRRRRRASRISLRRTTYLYIILYTQYTYLPLPIYVSREPAGRQSYRFIRIVRNGS